MLCVLVMCGTLPVAAEVRACSSQLVASGICPNAAHTLLSFAVPPSSVSGLHDAVAALVGYSPGTDLCTIMRVEERLCSTAEVGQVIPANQLVSRWVRAELIKRYKQHRALAAGDAARRGSLAEPDPEIP